MFDNLPEEHEKGVQAFKESLEHKTVECSQCGFEDAILHSDWGAHVEGVPESTHIRYTLVCPDCGGEETVEINL